MAPPFYSLKTFFGIIWRPLKKIFLPSRRVQTIYLLDNTEKGNKLINGGAIKEGFAKHSRGNLGSPTKLILFS